MIDQASAQRVVNFFHLAASDKITHVDALFQSAGGTVGDGIFLHHYFKALPIELTLHNVGLVASAAVVAYLGAHHRKASKTATFMLHNSIHSAAMSGAARFQNIAKSLVLDDERTQSILREFVKMPEELWTEMANHDLFLSAYDAVQYGVSEGISDFGPVNDGPLYNILV